MMLRMPRITSKVLREMYFVELAKYPTFQAATEAWSWHSFQGIYWHLTDSPDFKISLDKGPRDMSSLASGRVTPGELMVTSDLRHWAAYYGDSRPYAALIDLGSLEPYREYQNVSRGFGHEIMVYKPMKAVVVAVIPTKSAFKIYRRVQDHILPQNKEEHYNDWVRARESRSAISSVNSGASPRRGMPLDQ
jgi:hypothetical protein